MRTFDCFIFNDELDLLEMRLNILDKHIDKFVLTEGDKTFSGKPKISLYLKNINRFSKFKDKIIHNYIKFPNLKSPWEYEEYQRNSPTLLNCFEDQDLILTSDIDEIPNPIIISCSNEWLNDSFHFSFRQKRYVYYINNYETDIWFGTRACKYSYLRNRTISSIRESCEDESKLTGKVITNGGWHFTFLGGYDLIKSKIKSFSHTEYDNNKVLNSLKSNIENNTDPLDREGFRFTLCQIDDSFPSYIVENKNNFSKFIKFDDKKYKVLNPTNKNQSFFIINERLKSEINFLTIKNNKLKKDKRNLEEDNRRLYFENNNIKNSRIWRFSALYRKIMDKIKLKKIFSIFEKFKK